MKAGDLDRRVTLQKETRVDDPYTGPGPSTWADFVTRAPAQVRDDLPGNTESTQTGLRMSNHPARVRMRYLRGVTSDMRVIVHNETDEIYEITSTPAEIGRREWIEFTIRSYSS